MSTRNKSVMLLVTLLSAVWFLPLNTGAQAAEPKYGGTLRIGVRVAQENAIDARHLLTLTSIPTQDLIYDRLFT